MSVTYTLSQSGIMVLPDPVVDNRDPVNFTIPIRFLTQPVRVVIPRGPQTLDGDQVQLVMDGNRVGPIVTVLPAPAEIEVFIDTSFFIAGEDNTHQVDYWYRFDENGSEDTSNVNLRVRFDLEPPGGDPLAEIIFTNAQRTGLTAEDFVPDPMVVGIAPYPVMNVDDEYRVWIGSVADPGPDPVDPALGAWLPWRPVGPLNRRTNVDITRAEVQQAGDGQVFFRYELRDVRTNTSRLSEVTEITVTLQGPTLNPPVVPEFVNDGLITWPEANPDVQVQIPPYLTGLPQAGDVIHLFWGATEVLPAYTLLPGDVGLNPLHTFDVPLNTVRAVGNGGVVVRYEVRRAGSALPFPTAQTTVQVNLTTPGGEDTDPTTPTHENLFPATVVSFSNQTNIISAADFQAGRDATAVIPRVGRDGIVIWADGDVVQFFWQGISNPPILPVTIDGTNNGADLRIPVPFAGVIDQTGGGTFDFWYTVTRLLTVPGVPPTQVPVEVLSITDQVTVLSTSPLPGGDDDLPLADFPQADNRNFIIPIGTPGNYVRDTIFRIPLAGVANIAAGDRLSFRFIGHRMDRPNPAPLNAADLTVPLGPEIPGSELRPLPVDPIVLSAADIARGFIEVPLPFLNTTDFICRGGATLSYTLTNNAGPKDAPVRLTWVSLVIGGAACRIA